MRAIDVDPNSGRILLGTFGYGHNLFCFDADGKLLWKQFLPEHDVYVARWFDEGRKVVAATSRGWMLMLLDGETGNVLTRTHSSEWPTMHYLEGPVGTRVKVVVNAPRKQILVAGRSGLLALGFDGKPQWLHDRADQVASYPKQAMQVAAAEFPKSLVLGDVAVGNGGKRIALGEYYIIGTKQTSPGNYASIWAHRVVMLDAANGKPLAENTEDPGGATGPTGWSIRWPDGQPRPLVETSGLAAVLGEDGKLSDFNVPRPGIRLEDDGRLVDAPDQLTRLDADGRRLWQWRRRPPCIVEVDAITADQSRLYRCDRDARLLAIDLGSGKTLWEHQLPHVAKLTTIDGGVLAATGAGEVVRLDSDGRLLWSTRLREHHELPDGDYSTYLAEAMRRDQAKHLTVFPEGVDRPGDYDETLRFGTEQLIAGDCEQPGPWKLGDQPAPLASSGHAGKHALALDSGHLVTQQLDGRVIASATYLLEFHYRREQPEVTLTAGAMIDHEDADARPTLTAMKFSRGEPGTWAFGRVAIKTPLDVGRLTVGFEASGGPVQVDDVSLRPIRFPSPNLLANAQLHGVDPTYVEDIRVQYSRIPPELRKQLMTENHVAVYKQAGGNTALLFTQEQAFLHNGRLNDVGERWYYPPDPAGFSAVLQHPSFVSHVVLYLNYTRPEQAYETIAVLANDMETKLPRTVALVRGNRRPFVVIAFDEPVWTDSIKVVPGFHRAHREVLTEMELYGPLEDPESREKGLPEDPLGVAMFMGRPSHVPDTLPSDLVGAYRNVGSVHGGHYGPPCFHAGMTMIDGTAAVPVADGRIRRFNLPDPKDSRARFEALDDLQLCTVTPLGTPLWYGSRLLCAAADGNMHCVSRGGRHLWQFATGDRVYSSPAVQGDDVFFGSDDGRLYKVDVDSGMLLWEFATEGRIRSAPALSDGRVFFASGDGHLYAIHADTGRQAWRSPIARHTRAHPAADGGHVYLGDEQGRIAAFNTTDGKLVWEHRLGGYISHAPVVCPDGIGFVTEDGDAAMVDRQGKLRWRRKLGTRVTGQPIATATQWLIPAGDSLRVLRRGDGQPDDRFTPPEAGGPAIRSVVRYGDWLVTMRGEASNRFVAPNWYVEYSGTITAWYPEESEEGENGE